METFSPTSNSLDCLDLQEKSDENVDVSNLYLVGKILASKNLNKTAVLNIIQGAWKTRAKLVISSWLNNIFLFQFIDPEDRQRVLMEAPWSVMGYLLVLQPLALGRSVEQMDFKWSPFWIQVYGTPVAKLTRQNGEIIGRRIGNLIGVEALHDSLLLERSFLRLRVEVDVSKPLPRGFILQHHGSKDKESWVSYKYEKLSDFCYDYGRLGHESSSCTFVSREEGKNSGYGPELRTSRAPRLDTPEK
ncbi:hypothetical protein LOK49_LG07G00566 [Camellia lanceoleosa]|uniref:Uncharacterized protein n=1 Tax=Camellia lanceoleosa TaxID=1840588 RepID=A0ACC0GZ68_9ERIC|nr:hypothetical protein LOK49_LG07G00566 [Camellia lanceoleosa]